MMRKFTLALLAVALSATASLAQPSRKPVSNLHCDSALPMESSTPTKSAARLQQPLPAPAAGPNRMITDQPAGQHYYYSRSGDAYLYYFSIYYQKLEGSVSEMVFNDEGQAYLKNIITQYNRLTTSPYDAWIEGTVSENTITFEFPQPVLALQGTNYYATLMELNEQGTSYVKTSDQTLVLNYDPLTGDITPQKLSPISTGQMVVGLTDLAGSWTGYADWNISLQRVNEVTVSAPEGLATTDYTITAAGFGGTLGSAGFAGDDIYVQGLCPSLPNAWVKGTVSGDKAVFKSGQFLGGDTSNDCFVYLFAATSAQDTEGNVSYSLSDQDITFNYDAATQSLTGGSLFVTNRGKAAANPLAVYDNARICPFSETAATPVAPQGLTIYEDGFNNYKQGYGWGHMEFPLPNADAAGNYLVPEKMAYALYVRVNGEEQLLKLYNTDYQNQTEPVLEEVPYTYGDDWDIYVRGNLRSIYYFVVGPEAYGVQAIYRGGGEEHRSEIAWASVSTLGAAVQPEAATPAYPDVDPSDVGSEIRYTTQNGGETRGYFGDWNAKTYDIAMKLQDDDLTGTYIEEITFPLMRVQNISNVKIWLSSQLRLEGGVNVPDLASFDIESPRAGNITVKLDKPYIIPAEGVYVGYSLTVDKSSYNGSNGPLRILTTAKSTGFYIHSTNSILKWMDLGEGLSTATLMEVKLGGSKVKTNAVMPLNGESMFVHTDTDIKTTLRLVNHGSAGISSVDVEYTLNGETAQQHIDLKSSVAGTYGVQSVQTLTLPAISQRGTYDVPLRVVKVNGQPNEDANIEAVNRIVAINGEPKHRPLLEEYTGTWCGWCPRGFVALEKLAALYPDDYVCVSYHNADPMEITTTFPSEVSGFPRAWMDRGISMDPYYGTSGNKNFGILDDLKDRASQFGVADIDLAAKLSDDEQTVEVTAMVNFPFSNSNANYALEYMLIADGLTGPEGTNWDQSNYYSGQNYGSDMTAFQHAGSSVPGLVFNDVVVMLSQMGGIEGSIPEKVEADQPISHTYTFNLEGAVNTSGQNVIQDVNKLRVAAILIDKSEGYIVNANKAVVSTPVGIGTIASQEQRPASVDYFDLSGRRLQQLQPGLNIIRYNYANGTSRTRKVVK